MKEIWKYIIALLIGLFIGFMINIPGCSKVETIEIPVHDTITIDSIRILENTILKYKTKYDTIVSYIHETDTIEIPIYVPIEHYVYNDTINTDTTSTELYIAYQGYKAKLDSVGLVHHYTYKETVIPELKKRVSPFVFLQGGPKLDYNFKSVNGAAIEIGAGAIFKGGYGFMADYELGAGQCVDHTVKVGFIKQW